MAKYLSQPESSQSDRPHTGEKEDHIQKPAQNADDPGMADATKDNKHEAQETERRQHNNDQDREALPIPRENGMPL